MNRLSKILKYMAWVAAAAVGLAAIIGTGLFVATSGSYPVPTTVATDPIDPTAFWLAWGGMLFFGVMNALLNGSLFALMQTIVVPGIQGRVFTVMMSGVQATVPLGLLVAGPIVDRMGVSIWFVVAG